MKRALLPSGLLMIVVAVALGALVLRRHVASLPRGPVGPVSPERALRDLFGKRPSRSRVSLTDGRSARIWAEQVFSSGEVERAAVLVAIEKIGGDCHGCPATLGAVVYRKMNAPEPHWELESAEPEVGSIGSFGEAGSSKGLEARPIGPGKTVLLAPSSYTNQGFTERGDLLLVYMPPHWLGVGFVMTAEDNAAECAQDANAHVAARPDPCWSYTSELSLTPGDNPGFYDIRVDKKGTDQDGPAKPVTYVFDGKQYKER